MCKIAVNSSLNVGKNSSVKPSGTGDFVIESFLNYEYNFCIIIGLFKLSILYWVNCGSFRGTGLFHPSCQIFVCRVIASAWCLNSSLSDANPSLQSLTLPFHRPHESQ